MGLKLEGVTVDYRHADLMLKEPVMVSVLVGQRVDKEVSPYIATGVDTHLTEATEKDVKIRVGFVEVQRSA